MLNKTFSADDTTIELLNKFVLLVSRCELLCLHYVIDGHFHLLDTNKVEFSVANLVRQKSTIVTLGLAEALALLTVY